MSTPTLTRHLVPPQFSWPKSISQQRMRVMTRTLVPCSQADFQLIKPPTFAFPSVQAPRRAVDVAQLEQDRNFRGLVRVLEDASAGGATKANAAPPLRILTRVDGANRTVVVVSGAIRQLVELPRGGSAWGRENAGGTLGNLARGDAANNAAIITAGALPLLVELLRCGSNEGRAEAARALWNLAFGDAVNKAVIIAVDALPLLVELLHSDSDEGKENAAAALGILANGDAASRPAIFYFRRNAPTGGAAALGGSGRGQEERRIGSGRGLHRHAPRCLFHLIHQVKTPPTLEQ
jgi:hypothetical protein